MDEFNEMNNMDQNSTVQPDNSPSVSQNEDRLTSDSIISVPINIKSLTGWATFKAVMDIIQGASAASTIIFAGYGIPMIIAATKLLAYTEEVRQAVRTNDRQRLADSVLYLQKYFKLNGISTIVGIGIGILFTAAYLVFMIYLITNSSSFGNTSNMF